MPRSSPDSSKTKTQKSKEEEDNQFWQIRTSRSHHHQACFLYMEFSTTVLFNYRIHIYHSIDCCNVPIANAVFRVPTVLGESP
jgi:hypothetical protein